MLKPEGERGFGRATVWVSIVSSRGAVLTLERKSWDKGDCWNAGQVLERSSGWLKVGVRTLLERC